MELGNELEHVIVERVFAEPIEKEALARAVQAEHACFTSRRIRHLRSCLSSDGKRVICEYAAPDAESVRIANRLAGMAFERVWTAFTIEGKR